MVLNDHSALGADISIKEKVCKKMVNNQRKKVDSKSSSTYYNNNSCESKLCV